jgi:hypothetical protein
MVWAASKLSLPHIRFSLTGPGDGYPTPPAVALTGRWLKPAGQFSVRAADDRRGSISV